MTRMEAFQMNSCSGGPDAGKARHRMEMKGAAAPVRESYDIALVVATETSAARSRVRIGSPELVFQSSQGMIPAVGSLGQMQVSN